MTSCSDSHAGQLDFRAPLKRYREPWTLSSNCEMVIRIGLFNGYSHILRKTGNHIWHLGKVSTLLKTAEATLNLRKSKFFTRTVVNLAHWIRIKHLETAPHTTDAIRGLQQSINNTEPRSFSGLCNVFQRFVPNFARPGALLNKKLLREQPTNFGPLKRDGLAAMSALKEALVSLPAPVLPNCMEHITLDTHECDKQYVCVLQLKQKDATTIPIEYLSRTLNN